MSKTEIYENILKWVALVVKMGNLTYDQMFSHSLYLKNKKTEK